MGKRTLDKMRDKGVKTCPASRHAHLIVDAMRSKDGIGKLLQDAGYEPDCMADSLESVISSLWESRRYLEWKPLPVKGKMLYRGHWVPITPPSGEGAMTDTPIVTEADIIANERKAIAAWLRGEVETDYTDPEYDIGINLADAIERGAHKGNNMTDEQIKQITERFLAWCLPDDFSPDAGISFKPSYDVEPMRSRHWPVGTNLFSYNQAEAMVRHMLEGFSENGTPDEVTPQIDHTDDWMNWPKGEAAQLSTPEYPRFLIMRMQRVSYSPFTQWGVWRCYKDKDERDAEFARLAIYQPAWKLRCCDELRQPLSYG